MRQLPRPLGYPGTYGVWGPAELVPVDSVEQAGWNDYYLNPSRSPVFLCQVIPHFPAGCVPGTTGPFRYIGSSNAGCWNPHDGSNAIGAPPPLPVYLFDVFDTSVLSQLTISGPTETRPAGTGGNSTITLTAKATSGGFPKPGATISFAVEVTPNSGGHQHHDVARPKGALSAVQGTTDANGEVKLTFTAPEVAGIQTIGGCRSRCRTCCRSHPTRHKTQMAATCTL